jgi:hypothetical protein
VALWGFKDCNIYSCMAVDRLHQDYNGLSKHLFKALTSVLDPSGKGTSKDMAELRRRLQQMRGLPTAFYPMEGLQAPKTMAEENRGLMKFLGIALWGLVEDNMAQLFAGEYRR